MPLFREDRYDSMNYRRCGRWGIRLPAISLGGWQTFGGYVSDEVSRACLFRAFDLGITHFDLANNYGEPNGACEALCGRIIREMPRDELLISTKAGYDMWPGPYGEWLSRKHLVASLDQSLKRLQLDYVDVYYAHRTDPNTPTEEVMDALDAIVRQGKALYVGLSRHDPLELREKVAHCLARCTARPIIGQYPYSLLNRAVEAGTLQTCAELGMGVIVFSPLAQGLLSDKYLRDQPPEDSRLARSVDAAARRLADESPLGCVRQLNQLARERGQTLSQMAITWLLRRSEVTSVLIGASRPEQIEENVNALKAPLLTDEELAAIDLILTKKAGAPT